MEKYYGTIQFDNGEPIVVYGVGMSIKHSINDASKYTDDIESLVTTEITEELYDLVRSQGHTYGCPFLFCCCETVDIMQ